MNLDAIPDGAHVLIDANVFVYAMQGISIQCQRLLQRCARDQAVGVLSTHILAEVQHVLMIAEARDSGWIQGTNPAKQLSRQPERVAALRRYEFLIRDILGMGFQLESLHREDFLSALEIQHQSGLLTNDALLAALGLRLGVRSLASADMAFE